MKSIEKPLTIVLLIAFTLLVYFFECRPAQEEKLIEELNQAEEIIEEVIEFEEIEIDSTSIIQDTIEEKEPYYKTLRDESVND